MNLYATPRRESVNINRRAIPTIHSHTLYLESLSRENAGVKPMFELVTTIRHGDKKLFVITHNGLNYLSDGYILGEGIANILYSSKKLARVIGYGEKLIKE